MRAAAAAAAALAPGPISTALGLVDPSTVAGLFVSSRSTGLRARRDSACFEAAGERERLLRRSNRDRAGGGEARSKRERRESDMMVIFEVDRRPNVGVLSWWLDVVGVLLCGKKSRGWSCVSNKVVAKP